MENRIVSFRLRALTQSSQLIQQAHPLGIVPREWKQMFEHYLHIHIHYSIIHNNPKVETTYLSISWSVNQSIVVCSCEGMLFAHTKRSEGLIHANIKPVMEIRHKMPHKSIEAENQNSPGTGSLAICRSETGRVWGFLLGRLEKVLELPDGSDSSTHCKCT